MWSTIKTQPACGLIHFKMAMNALVLLFMTSTVLLGDVTQAVDCNAPPNFRISKNCCNIPDPDWKQLPECNKYMKEQSRKGFRCAASCIFNSTGAIDSNGKLNLPNLRSAIVRFIPLEDDVFDNTVIPAFKECETEIQHLKDKNNLQNMPRRGGSESECPMLPQIYFMCSGAKIFMNCPSTYWTDSNECQSIKDYMANCDRKFSGRKFSGRRGAQRLGVQFI